MGLLATVWLTGCQTGTAPTGRTNTTTVDSRKMAPKHMDVRGIITGSRYNQGQVVLEVEGMPSPENRYNRAIVLVQPTTQIEGPDGQSISLSELRLGQNVAVLMRSGGQGNMVGLGIARRVWVEN